MILVIQLGIIIFLVFLLAIIYQDEFRKKRLARKSARLNRFWACDKDRRESIRIDTEIGVLYEVISSGVNKRQPSVSRNVSLGGINLALNEKLLPSTILKLQLNIPTTTKPIFTQGRIVWVREMAEKFTGQQKERFFATGIKFIQMSPEDEAILRSFINNQKTRYAQEPSKS